MGIFARNILSWSRRYARLFLPGTIFGLLLSATLLEEPGRNWPRILILLWVSTVAHATIWLTGLTIVGLLLESDFSPPGPDWLEEAIGYALLGIPSGIVFGIIVAVGTARVLCSKFSRRDWVLILTVNAACGMAYVDAVASGGYLGHLNALLHYRTGFDGAGIYVAYIVWYAAALTLLARAEPREFTGTTKADIATLSALVGLTTIIWLVFEQFSVFVSV